MLTFYVTLLIAPLLLATAQSELLFLDFTTSAEVGKVKDAFAVVAYEGADLPRDINLPADASVTSYSVTTLSTYFSYFGVETPPQEGFPQLSDDNLYFVDRNTDYTGINEDQMQALIATHARKVGPAAAQIKPSIFVPVASSPLKELFFINLDPASLTALFNNNADLLGGPGQVNVEVHRIVQI
nr:hypothetical protein BaRGS_029409 [Batillaria attramentaria]